MIRLSVGAPTASTRRGLLLGSIAGTCGFGISAPTVVLPEIASALGVHQAVTAWVLAGFALGVGLASALGGSWLDIVGTRRVVASGAASTVAGAVIAVLTPSFALLIAAELLMGFGTGLICISAFHAVSYLPESDRARASGILTAVSFSCISAGPFAGAVINELVGWRGALVLCVLTIAGAPALLRGLPKVDPPGGQIDLLGVALATCAAISLAALLQTPATNAPLRLTVALAGLLGALALLLRRHVHARPHGFLPAEVVRSPGFMRLSLVGGSVQAGYSAILFAGPLLLAEHAGWNALMTGLALLPAAAAATISANLVGRVNASRSTAGLFAILAVISAAAVAVVAVGSRTPTLIVVGAMIAVAAYAGVQTIAIDRIPRLVPAGVSGAGLGTFMYLFITGGAVGSAATGGLAAVGGLSTALLAVTVLPLGGFVLARSIRAGVGARPAPAAPATSEPA